MASQNDSIVTFTNSRGEEISNDPRWHAQKTLQAAGMSPQPVAVSSQLVAENESLKARIAALEAAAASQGVEDEDDDEDDDNENEVEDQFQTMTGKELKTYAKENGIDISGLTKVGEVRARLRESASE